MPIQRVGPDANGLFYQVVGTAEWQGPYGAQLRGQGYRYCGFGSYGVIVAGPGEECYTRVSAPPPPPGGGVQPPGPNIGPTVPPETTGGVGSTPPPVHVGGGCGCGGKTTEPVTQPTQPGAPPPPSTTPVVAGAPSSTVFLAQLKGLPWWVIVLALLAASQLFNRGSARG